MESLVLFNNSINSLNILWILLATQNHAYYLINIVTASESWHSAMEVWSSQLPRSPNYSEELSRTLCQHWPRTDPIWPLAHTRQSLVSLTVKRTSMSPTLIVISSNRLQGTMNNPLHLPTGYATAQRLQMASSATKLLYYPSIMMW